MWSFRLVTNVLPGFHLRWLGIYLHLQGDNCFQWLGAEILEVLPENCFLDFTHLWSQKKIMDKLYGIPVIFVGQEAMQHQRGKANGGIAWGELFLVWVHRHRKWAAVVDAWCDSCLACGILKIFRTLVAPNLWMVVFWYKQLHNGKVQYFWMQAQKMLLTPLN